MKFQKSKTIKILSVVIIGIVLIGLMVFGKDTALQQGDLLTDRLKPPSWENWFGTDRLGRDVFARTLFGGTISLLIAGCVTGMTLLLGSLVGAVSGYIGGKVDMILMRFLDFMMAIPLIFVLIAATALFQPGLVGIIILLSLTSWMETARLIRAEVISIRKKEFFLALESMGVPHFRMIRKHVLPNSITPIITLLPLKISEVILLESGLSFLGIGIQPPIPTWGNMLYEGQQTMPEAWWITLFPGFFLFLVVSAFNILGRRVRKKITG
ncbi:MAG: ABC transporter permease [Calditrichia bacterium]